MILFQVFEKHQGYLSSTSEELTSILLNPSFGDGDGSSADGTSAIGDSNFEISHDVTSNSDDSKKITINFYNFQAL